MGDPVLEDRFKRLNDSSLCDTRDALQLKLGKIASEFVARGTFHSSMHCESLRSALAEELLSRSTRALEDMRRALQSLRTTPLETDRDVMKALLSSQINSSLAELAPLVVSRGPKGLSYTPKPLDEVRDRAIRRMEIEVDMLVDEAGIRLTPATSQAGSMVFNGPVGAVQTGEGAVAIVSPGFTPEDVSFLINALETARSEIASANISDETKQSLLVETDRCRHAVLDGSQSKRSLLDALSAIGTTVQTVGAAQGAYEALAKMIRFLTG